MRKKLFTLLYAISACAGMIAAEKVKIGDLYYNLDSNTKTAEVTYEQNTSESPSYSHLESEAITIPNSVEYNAKTYSVTGIGEHAFSYCSGLNSINIPSSVISIGNFAFSHCSGLYSINIPDGVISIGHNVFNSCDSLPVVENLRYADTYLVGAVDKTLSSYTIKEGTRWIGNSAFSGCDNLTSIVIPNGVKSIENNAFWGCTNMTSTEIPNSVTSIGLESFRECSSLTTVIIPNSVTSLGSGAFYHCYNLTSITLSNSLTAISLKTFYLCSNLSSIVIPDGVKSIGDGAFTYCKSLKSINIPNSVTSIESPFSGCENLPVFNNLRYADTYLVEAVDKTLSTYTIKEGTKWIGGLAFYQCSNLSSITIPNSVISVGYRAFEYCTSLPVFNNLRYADTYLVEAVNKTLSTYTIKEGTKWIGSYAFSNCNNLTSIVIPNGVKSIDRRAFYRRTSLTSIDIPNSVTSIGDETFYYCTNLTSIEIPNSVTSIGDEAFYYCTNLTSIEIPNSVTSIGDDAFASVNNVLYGGTATGSPWGARCINGIYDGWLLYNSDATSLVYCSPKAEGNITMRNSITRIESLAFYECSNITNITIPDNVKSIGELAFLYCINLTSIELPNSVTSIEDGAFNGCNSLSSINIPNSVISIGQSVFGGCNNLPVFNNLRYADTYLVGAVDKTLSTYTIKEGTKWIGDYAFNNCSDLSSITIPNDVLNIERDAFKNCNKLATINVLAQIPPRISNSSTFKDISSDAIVYIPPFSMNTYKSADYWRDMNLQTKVTVDEDDIHVSPTGCTIFFEPSELIASVTVKDGETFNGNVLEYVGLDPASEYKDIPVVLTSHTGETETMKVSFKTADLELTTKESKPVSSSTAILLAETNMSDAETYCGFEYKRNDAPEDMSGTKVYSPVANGVMAGRLKNLKDDVYYKYRAFYQSAAGNMYYGDWKYIFTGDNAVEFDPILYTYEPVVVSENETTLKGYALAGSEDFTEQGFEYWAESRVPQANGAPAYMPAALGEHKTVQAKGIKMQVTLTDLDAGTIYKYRTYAKVGNETLYGAEMSFTTQGEYEDTEDVENILEKPAIRSHKTLHNGQILILLGDKVYTITGQEVK